MQRRDEYVINAAGNAGGAPVGTDRHLPIKGYYIQGTFIVTGEEKIPDTRITPKHNFEPWNGGWGALEIGARYGGVWVDPNRVKDINGANAFNVVPLGAGAPPPTVPPRGTGNSNRAEALTVGANWWLTKNVRWAFDYVHEQYNDGVQIVDSSETNSSHRHNFGGFLTQIQIDF